MCNPHRSIAIVECEVTVSNTENRPNNEADGPPNERPLKLPFDDWKDALGEFLERETEDEPRPQEQPQSESEDD